MGKKKKNAWIPRTDANQNVRESLERKTRHEEALRRKYAEWLAKQQMAQQEMQASQSKTVDGLQKEN